MEERMSVDAPSTEPTLSRTHCRTAASEIQWLGWIPSTAMCAVEQNRNFAVQFYLSELKTPYMRGTEDSGTTAESAREDS